MWRGAVSSSSRRRLEKMGGKQETKEDREILQVPQANADEENPKTRGCEASRCPDDEDREI